MLIIDDINRLRMHRAGDQDVLDFMRAFMGLDVTLILTGVNIPGTGLLQWCTPVPTGAGRGRRRHTSRSRTG
ncbi:hypothetical protein ACWEGQ_06950 [Streptomyces seoulensis]